MPSAGAGGRLLFAGAPRRHRVRSGPAPPLYTPPLSPSPGHPPTLPFPPLPLPAGTEGTRARPDLAVTT